VKNPCHPLGGAREKPWKPIEASDLRTADALLRKAQLPWFNGLDTDERRALGDYKGNAGRLMNRALRGAMPASGFGRDAAPLQRALARARAPADMLVYRGVGPAEAALYKGMARGDTVRTAAFLSTSIAQPAAGALAALEGGAVVELVLRRGQKGVAYVHPFPTYRYPQHEVLLNAGSVLRVLRADAEAIRLEVACDNDIE
jgi:hypothetical protein